MKDKPRAEPHVVRDLAMRNSDHIGQEMRRLSSYVEHPLDMFAISLGGLCAAVATSAAFLSASDGVKHDPYVVAIEVLNLIRDTRSSLDPETLATLALTAVNRRSQ